MTVILLLIQQLSQLTSKKRSTGGKREEPERGHIILCWGTALRYKSRTRRLWGDKAGGTTHREQLFHSRPLFVHIPETATKNSAKKQMSRPFKVFEEKEKHNCMKPQVCKVVKQHDCSLLCLFSAAEARKEPPQIKSPSAELQEDS